MARRIRRVRLRLTSNRRQAIFWVVAIAMLVLLQRWYARPEALSPGVYRADRVVDGDTLVLANRQRVRLIGANTPETVKPNHPVEPWGPEATEFTRRFVAGGEVRIQFDGRCNDKYGRWLAHVWVDDRMLEEELIRAGLARAETGYSYSSEMKARFLKAQSQARPAGRGIWSR
ncbi:MAG: thermonuclease family protein [Planctomycetota bacterium]|jgi:micrococcal nuclease